jgi:glycosyltransferase involved in cell wall biosynthesis
MTENESHNKTPLVTIITPSYQQAKYIGETIKSVWSQDYPNIEHIVVDGGSTDGTVNILKKFARSEPRFRYISEKDRGQSHALNKGLAMAKGEIIGWLNSDDTYHPKAIRRAVQMLRKHAEYGAVYGKANHTDAGNRVLYPYPVDASINKSRLFDVCTICQPAVFIRKSALDQVGAIDESLNFCMDYDLWMRLVKKHKFGFINEIIANSRLHEEAKSVKQYFSVGLPEIIRTSLKNYGAVSNHWLIQFIAHHLLEGPAWLIERLKTYHVFGSTPVVRQSNRYEDSWVAPRWKIEIEGNAAAPLKCLLVAGEHLLPEIQNGVGKLQWTIYINGRQFRTMELEKGKFTAEIPLPPNTSSCSIEIRSHAFFVPSKLKMSSDHRELSFKVSHVVPLTKDEAALFRIMGEEPAAVGHWLVKHRKIKQ